MGTTLDNGIYLPDEGERNCYEGLAGNWVALDNHIGSTNIHVTINDKQAWNGHVADTTIHVTSADKQTWNSHVADTTIHVTAGDKQAWNGKADASALTAHTGDTTIHVTAEDKAKWNAVTSKADDSAVVHKSGNETVSGQKTFSDNLTIYNSDDTQTPKGLTIRNAQWGMGESGGTTASGINFLDKNSAIPASIIASKGIYGQSFLRFRVRTKDSQNNTLGEEIYYDIDTSGNVEFRSWHDNSISLGTSANKWKDVQTKLINGLTPSSLSLPSDRSASIDISSYFTNTGTGQSNSYTVPANGYIYLALSELTNIHCFSRTSGNVINYAQTFTKPNNSTGVLYVLFPVRKNDVFVTTWYTTTTVSVDGAFFIPCQGNI